jgi:peptidoglycan/xylan/chitin deacetylase (PgdA/CDA1 family)
VPTALSRTLARAAAGVLAVAVTVAVTGCRSGGATLGSAGQVHLLSLIAPGLGATTPTPGRLYRIVGCRSGGAIAYSHGPHRYEVAIGFDDGPDQDTPAFVTMLARNHATATFFLIGDQITPAYRPTMLRELREGDVIGDHTYTHPYLTRTGEVRAQLQRTIAAIDAQTGYAPCVFRPPYGAFDSSVLQTAGSLGLATITWSVDPSDYTQPGTATIVHRVLSQVQPGSIVISHDGGGPRGQTLAAYPKIIAALRRRGFGIVTIPQLLGFRPVYEPCVRLCDGLGVPRGKVPHEAIIQPAP